MVQHSAQKPHRKEPAPRVSITFPASDYSGLKETAGRLRVSIAWVVRDAVHAYLQRPAGRRRIAASALPATPPDR